MSEEIQSAHREAAPAGGRGDFMITQDMQKTYLSILREELVPATGCT